MNQRFDIAIVGAGMAGASLAAHIAGKASVLLLEAEDQPGYHATGRSAAFWTESYGGPMIQPLTAASGAYLREGGFLTPRGALTIGRQGQGGLIDDFTRRFSDLGVAIERLGRSELEASIPGLRPDWDHGALEPSCADIDVAGLHAHYLGIARRGGAVVRTRCGLVAADRDEAGWRVETTGGERIACDVLVNAAGAWADGVARAAGVASLGIAPMRRTMVQVAVSPRAPANLPLVLDIGEAFYFKPERGGVWLSPHDEAPSAACDAAADEVDVAVAVERFGQVVDWQVKRVEHRWAGLRSFARDRLPVFGFDPRQPGFFWFAGQGGFGIQTAPAAAAIGEALLLGGDAPVDPAPFLPNRFS